MARICLVRIGLKRLAAVVFLCAQLMVANPSLGQSVNLSGKWEANYFFNRITVEMEHKGPSVRGVLVLYEATGDINTYHFEGIYWEGRLEARHHSGHAFEGVMRENLLSGTLTMKTGEKYPIYVTDFRRVQ